MIGGITAFLIALGAFQIIRDPKNLKDYEEDFHNRYHLRPKKVVKLAINRQEKAELLELCKNYVWNRTLRKNPPGVERHFLGFKKTVHHPYKIQLIRCNDKIGIIRTGHRDCAYLLNLGKRSKHYIGKSGKKEKHAPGLIFHIKAKICYDKKFQNAIHPEDVVQQWNQQDGTFVLREPQPLQPQALPFVEEQKYHPEMNPQLYAPHHQLHHEENVRYLDDERAQNDGYIDREQIHQPGEEYLQDERRVQFKEPLLPSDLEQYPHFATYRSRTGQPPLENEINRFETNNGPHQPLMTAEPITTRG